MEGELLILAAFVGLLGLRARIRAETTPHFQRKLEARATKELVI